MMVSRASQHAMGGFGAIWTFSRRALPVRAGAAAAAMRASDRHVHVDI
jgi:hypothetical protein